MISVYFLLDFSLLFNSMFSFSELIDLGAIKL